MGYHVFRKMRGLDVAKWQPHVGLRLGVSQVLKKMMLYKLYTYQYPVTLW